MKKTRKLGSPSKFRRFKQYLPSQTRKNKKKQSGLLLYNTDEYSSQETLESQASTSYADYTKCTASAESIKSEKLGSEIAVQNTSEIYLEWIKRRIDFHENGFMCDEAEKEYRLNELKQLKGSVGEIGRKKIDDLVVKLERKKRYYKKKLSKYKTEDFHALYDELAEISMNASKSNDPPSQKNVESPDLFSSESELNSDDKLKGAVHSNNEMQLKSTDHVKNTHASKICNKLDKPGDSINVERMFSIDDSCAAKNDTGINRTITQSISNFDTCLLTNDHFASSEALQHEINPKGLRTDKTSLPNANCDNSDSDTCVLTNNDVCNDLDDNTVNDNAGRSVNGEFQTALIPDKTEECLVPVDTSKGAIQHDKINLLNDCWKNGTSQDSDGMSIIIGKKRALETKTTEIAGNDVVGLNSTFQLLGLEKATPNMENDDLAGFLQSFINSDDILNDLNPTQLLDSECFYPDAEMPIDKNETKNSTHENQLFAVSKNMTSIAEHRGNLEYCHLTERKNETGTSKMLHDLTSDETISLDVLTQISKTYKLTNNFGCGNGRSLGSEWNNPTQLQDSFQHFGVNKRQKENTETSATTNPAAATGPIAVRSSSKPRKMFAESYLSQCNENFSTSFSPESKRRTTSDASSVDFLNETNSPLNVMKDSQLQELVGSLDARVRKFESDHVLDGSFFEMLDEFTRFTDDSIARVVNCLMRKKEKPVVKCEEKRKPEVNPFFYDGSQDLSGGIQEEGSCSLSNHDFHSEMIKLSTALSMEVEKHPHILEEKRDGPMPDWRKLFPKK